MNTQPIEKQVRFGSNGRRLDVHSIFYTLQCEGPFAGMPCVFVRLAGCNLQCPGCDTEYTQGRQEMSIQELTGRIHDLYLDNAYASVRRFVVITGGEPFRQQLAPFIRLLLNQDYMIQIESNGTLPPPISDFEYELDINRRKGVYIVCSPKAPKVHPLFHHLACCFKYVMSHDSVDPIDGLPITVLRNVNAQRVARPEWSAWKGRPIYLQPADHSEQYRSWIDLVPYQKSNLIAIDNKLSMQAVVASCLRHGYILQLQTHKIIGVE